MPRTDLATPASVGSFKAVRALSGFVRLCSPGILIFSFVVFGATQSYAQDVADAARQENARKQKQHKKSKHVYTEEDLKRAQILAPEDRAQIEAKKNQPAPPAAENSRDAVDAQSLPANAPLGDVARQLRRQKELEQLRRSAEFHIQVPDAPVLASPKPLVQPLLPPTSKPARPNFAPFRPPVKRSPFQRPSIILPAPPRVLPSQPPAVRVTPALPATRTPIAPPANSKLGVVTVQPGDSLWRLAQQKLGQGLRWHELLSVNPNITNPNHIEAGTQLYLPAAVSPVRTATKFTVREGDTLTGIAQTQLGHASYWSCIAHANPSIRDANLIFAGQVLLLPASCTP
jgi:nucleoid-associated protein YgaU